MTAIAIRRLLFRPTIVAGIAAGFAGSIANAQEVKIDRILNHGSVDTVSPADYGVFENSLVFSVNDRLFRLASAGAEPIEIPLSPGLGAGKSLNARFAVFDGALFMHADRNPTDNNAPRWSDTAHLHRLDGLDRSPVWIDIPNEDHPTPGEDIPGYGDSTREFAVYQNRLYFFSRRPSAGSFDSSARWGHGLFRLEGARAQPLQVDWTSYVYGETLTPSGLLASELGLTFYSGIVTDHNGDFTMYHQIKDPKVLVGSPWSAPYTEFGILLNRSYGGFTKDFAIFDGKGFVASEASLTLENPDYPNPGPYRAGVENYLGAITQIELFRFDAISSGYPYYDLNPVPGTSEELQDILDSGGRINSDSKPSNFVVTPNSLYFKALPDGVDARLYRLSSAQQLPQVVSVDLGNDPRPVASLGTGLVVAAGVSGSQELFYLADGSSTAVALNVGNRVAETATAFTEWQGKLIFSAKDDANDHGTYALSVNDSGSLPEIQLTDIRVNEGDGFARVTARLSQPSSQTVRVLTFSRMTANAVAGKDFYGFTQAVEFAPGESNKQIDVNILNDAVVEPQESFSVIAVNPENARLTERSNAEVTIVDDDADQLPQILMSNLTVRENQGVAEITVSLSRSSSQSVRAIVFTQQSGAAVGGQDFYGFTSRVEFAPGETKKNISLTILDDAIPEDSETLTVRAGNPENARLTLRSTSEITILDNDQ